MNKQETLEGMAYGIAKADWRFFKRDYPGKIFTENKKQYLMRATEALEALVECIPELRNDSIYGKSAFLEFYDELKSWGKK